jgi:peptide methionine sulfoxide reductase MsrA
MYTMTFSRHCLLLVAIVQCNSSALSAAESARASISMYFGNGCFFARQNLFVNHFERKVLGRDDGQLSSIAGYAGSMKTGPHGAACYHNPRNFSDYGTLGHAEAVEIEVPLVSLDEVFAIYFDSFIQLEKGSWVRPDMYDQGAEYRSLIGVPGGLTNTRVLAAMHRANVHNMTLRPGQGSDPDTFLSNTVLVMDTARFPFIQAELCLQFHDDTNVKYPLSYHRYAGYLQKEGRLRASSCPSNFICNSIRSATQSDAIMI